MIAYDFPRTIELETALLDDCDLQLIKSICKCRPIPEHLRCEVWPICLGVQGKADSLTTFDELFDMEEQVLVREDCQGLVGKYTSLTYIICHTQKSEIILLVCI